LSYVAFCYGIVMCSHGFVDRSSPVSASNNPVKLMAMNFLLFFIWIATSIVSTPMVPIAALIVFMIVSFFVF